MFRVGRFGGAGGGLALAFVLNTVWGKGVVEQKPSI